MAFLPAPETAAYIDKDVAKTYNINGMETDKRIRALVIAPVIIGLILIVIGIVSQGTAVLYAGITVLFGGSGIAAFITVAITVISVRRGNSENTVGSAAQGDPDGETKPADGKARRSDTGKKVFSALFVFAFLGCLIGGMALLSVGYTAVGVTVFGCAFLIIVGAIIISSARARIARSKALETDKYTLRIADVDSCEACGTVAVMDVDTGCKYTVRFTVGGKQYSAKSRESYCPGDRLKVLLHENGEKVKIVGKANAADKEDIKSGKHSAVRAAQKKLTDSDREYRDKAEEELTRESEQLLEMDNVTDADIDELADREIEIEMEYLESDKTAEDFDSYWAKRRLLYDEMRRKIMNNPPLDDEPFAEPEDETPFVEPDGKDEPESDTPFAEPIDTPPIVPTEKKEPETPPAAAKAAEAPIDIKEPSDAANEDGGSTEPETPSHVPTESVRPTRTKRAAVGYKGIKKK